MSENMTASLWKPEPQARKNQECSDRKMQVE